jgi:hypothetical protein
MNFTANAAATAHTIAYSGTAMAGAAATATAAAGAYTVYAGDGSGPVQINVSVNRKSAGTRTLPTSIPSAVDPLSSRASGTTLAAATGTKSVRRAATSQWDH